LLDGTRTYLHALLDNFSRRILAWKLAPHLEPQTTCQILAEAAKNLPKDGGGATVVADSGVENVNQEVDKLLGLGQLRRVLAQVEVSFSNSLIEAIHARALGTVGIAPRQSRWRELLPGEHRPARCRGSRARCSTLGLAQNDLIARHAVGTVLRWPVPVWDCGQQRIVKEVLTRVRPAQIYSGHTRANSRARAAE
jgi:hypothetical protein